MRRSIIISVLITGCISLRAQEYNAQWILSYNTSVMKFGSVSDTVGLDTISGNMPMLSTDANICDTNGNLLFFTNGVYIADRNGNMLINGDSLSPCTYTYQYFNNGLGINQAALFLPKPGNSRYYYLIHFSNDTEGGIRPGTLYYSIIDAEGNGGLGTVIEKNVPFFRGVVLREGGLTACKHANGRDYWIVIGGHNDNTYYEFLITPDSILGPYKQNFGPVYNTTYDWAYSKFSQDGSRYVTSCAVGLILVADFDRCSGLFSNSFTLYNNASTIGNISLADSVNRAVREFLGYFKNSSIANNFSFAVITFDDTAKVHTPITELSKVDDFADYNPMVGHGGGTYIGGALEIAEQLTSQFLNSPDASSVTHDVRIIIMSDGLCQAPAETKTVADRIKVNNKVMLCTHR